MVVHRRTLIGSGLAALVAASCGGQRRAAASTPAYGCRMAESGNADRNEDWRTRLRSASGQRVEFDRECRRLAESVFPKHFGVEPAFSFYDDGKLPNALATTECASAGCPHGTVMLGIELLKKEIRKRPLSYSNHAFAILAHEFGHILQYKLRLRPDGPWQMEPHADFMAGWMVARGLATPPGDPRLTIIQPLELEEALASLYALGDRDIDTCKHHGQPDFRAAMVRAGYDAHRLDANAAFIKGAELCGLADAIKRSGYNLSPCRVGAH
jgi:hypothetical protein